MEWNSQLHRLVSHNNDLKRLAEKGYALSIDNNYLIVRDIPYLTDKGECEIGAIVAKLRYVNGNEVEPEDHQIYFCGSHPYNTNGTAIANLGGGPTTFELGSKDLRVERSFSSKPVDKNGQLRPYTDHFEKIEHYVSMFSGPAIAKYPSIVPYPLTFNQTNEVTDSVFKVNDTLTSRAEILDLSQKFKDDIVAVIGLGGTGAYLIDFLIKTPVKEIRGYDSDYYYVHNAFRSPGRLESNELGKLKAEVYQNRYDNFREGLSLKSKYIDSNSEEDMKGVTFAFVCVDKGSSRSDIFKLLIKMQIPFIDVGMGLDKAKGKISGMLRTTYYPAGSAQVLVDKRLAPMADYPDDEYKVNIQISELNAMNASIAILKYKQIRGFYSDCRDYYNVLFDINDSHIVGENEF